MQPRRFHRPNGRGFSLIELMVVISIVVILTTILLPALGQSRDVAEGVLCQNNIRQAGIGLAVYTNTNDDWLPGPNTSGTAIEGVYPSGSLADGIALATGSSKPLQYTDWISPTIGEELGLSHDPAERLIQILDTKFRCPSNDVRYKAEYTGVSPRLPLPGNPQEHTLLSYGANIYWHVSPNIDFDVVNATGGGVPWSWPYSNFEYPDSYVPRMTQIKKTSTKVFAAEGSRFWNGGSIDDASNPTYTGFFSEPSLVGGTFMHSFGNFNGNGGHPWKWGRQFSFGSFSFFSTQDTTGWSAAALDRVAGKHHDTGMSEMTRANGFRHLGNTNASMFFDGHAEVLKASELIQVERILPTGTTYPGFRSDDTVDPDDNGDPVG